VASEVRALAGRSAQAATEIKALIGASAEKVAGGSRLVGKTGSTMTGIVAQVRRVICWARSVPPAPSRAPASARSAMPSRNSIR
jgi:hypothetical protein